MSDTTSSENIKNSNTSLYKIIKNCVNLQSYENLPVEDYNDVCASSYGEGIGSVSYTMIAARNTYATSSTISTSSYASDDSFGDNILEENGRISLAYENLQTIPRRIAEKFAPQTKCLDLSYNKFQNLSFLSFFDELHTLILDRNSRLNVNTLPFLPSLKILWINNCDISNLTNWIQRIQMQCPSLEHLSIMGNPGIQQVFNYCILTPSHPLPNESIPSVATSDYREYILNMMPNLEILDGLPRYGNTSAIQKASLSTSSSNGQKSSSSSSMVNGSGVAPAGQTAAAAAKVHNANSRKTTPTLRFKDLFRLKQRKKSQPSSSTTN